MSRLRVVAVWEYDADPKDYDTNDLAEMVAIDQKNFDVYGLETVLSSGGFSDITPVVKVEAVD